MYVIVTLVKSNIGHLSNATRALSVNPVSPLQYVVKLYNVEM